MFKMRMTATRNSNGSVDLRPAEDEGNPKEIDHVSVATLSGLALKEFEVDSDFIVEISAAEPESEDSPRKARRKHK